MASYSDHSKQSHNVNDLLPEVFRSDVNRSIYDMAFNRHLTKDDTQRVAGFIGESNAQAIVDRQVKEATPHRQAYQLAPTMCSTVGTVDTALSYKAFLAQLSMMGVDVGQLNDWASTEQFNWIPPVNADMLVNYQDYFWRPAAGESSTPQYITMESACNKAASRARAYGNMLSQRGSNFNVARVSFKDDYFVVEGALTDLFVDGFTFTTSDTTNPNVAGSTWTVAVSEYDPTTNETTVHVVESIAASGSTPPVGTAANAVTVTNGGTGYGASGTVEGVKLKGGSGSGALATVTVSSGVITSVEVTDGGRGYAIGDALTLGLIGANAQVTIVSLKPYADQWWYDTSVSALMRWDTQTSTFVVAPQSHVFSLDLSGQLAEYRKEANCACGGSFGWDMGQWDTGEGLQWDIAADCDVTTNNTEWTAQNRWIHKSEVQSFVDVKRAQLPILEYNSNIELNEWIETHRTWKYRAEVASSFGSTSASPSKLELEPVKEYTAATSSEGWVITLGSAHTSAQPGDNLVLRDVDYTDVFAPGFMFRIIDNTGTSYTYEVQSAIYREVQPGMWSTAVTLSNTTYFSPTAGGGTAQARIEPYRTSQGDAWLGYHAHWMLEPTSAYTTPAASQPVNHILAESLAETADGVDVSTMVHDDDGASFQPSAGVWRRGKRHQDLTTDEAGVTRVDLFDNFRAIKADSVFALAGSGEVRVYVNNVRQYATYDEIVGTYDPTTADVKLDTYVGQTAISSSTFQYVKAILFHTPLKKRDVVRVEVGAAATSDLGWTAVPVRTIEDEDAFTVAVASGTQPEYQSLVRYNKREQIKSVHVQYPLFNVYDVSTSDVVKANQLFAYKESSDAAVNPLVNLRIDASAGDFKFEQLLVERTNGEMYSYRNLSTQVKSWFNPSTNEVRVWDGRAWNSKVVVTSDGLRSYVQPTVQQYAPFGTTMPVGTMWFDQSTSWLYKFDGVTWNQEDVTINNADPTLQSVWRGGQTYVPDYVNGERTPVAIGSEDGDWELAHQWRFNPEHENHKELKYTQLITHLRTILLGQPKIPGLQGGGVFTLTQDQMNYSVGGTIKEHNGGFDTLISAVNVTSATPLSVIEFAAQQYESNLLTIRDAFSRNVVKLLTSTSQQSLVDPTKFISNTVIGTYESNDFATYVYSDTHAFDPETNKGVRNWISTLPMFGLAQLYRPHMSVDDNGVVHLLHHDGHRSVAYYTNAELDRYARAICAAEDTRGTDATFGKVSSAQPPQTYQALVDSFGSARPAVFWYRTGAVRSLFKLNVCNIGSSNPTLVYPDGTELPDGIKSYNPVTDTTWRKQGMSWVVDSATFGELWEKVNLPALLGSVILEVEQRLYDVTPHINAAFDYASLSSTPTRSLSFEANMQKRLSKYFAARQVVTPYINSDYIASNPFTWNYSTSSSPAIPPRSLSVGESIKSVASWQALYEQWYGTPYPHLEPWKLQGYHDKPTWWDNTYADATGVRRWTSAMWSNVRAGIVPAGCTYPLGKLSTGDTAADAQFVPAYNYCSVNLDTDELLAPRAAAQVGTNPASRSLFVSTSEVNSKDADFTYGDMSPEEWKWSVSSLHGYDMAVVAFMMQPVKFLHAAFGPHHVSISGLDVDTVFKRVYSHSNTLFHGDLYDTNVVYRVRGLNQWFVNLNRYSGTDTNGEFNQRWTQWSPKLTYQLGGIADTSTFEITTKYYDLGSHDYDIKLINSGAVDDLWVDAFEASLIHIPPALVQYNNQAAWKIELETLTNADRAIQYFGVRSYDFVLATNTEMTAFAYTIVHVDATAKRIYVRGDQTATINSNTEITVNQPNNAGTFTVLASTFEPTTNRTRLTVSSALVDSTAAGVVTVNKALPWVTGDAVVVQSSKFLPAPLQPHTPYYIIKTSQQGFKLALSADEAAEGLAIEMTSAGDGAFTVSQVEASFYVLGGQGNTADLWHHFVIDTTDVRQFIAPSTIVGMQNFINVFDGYAAYKRTTNHAQGVADTSEFDPDTGRLVGWGVEIERFVNWAYGLRQARVTVADRYPVFASHQTGEFTFGAVNPMWLSGTAVNVSSTGTLPEPLVSDSAYYIVNAGVMGTVRLSTSADARDTAAWVTLSDAGSGQMSLGLFNKNRAYPRFEINANRRNVWVNTPIGVLSDIISGPYNDIRVQQTIVDQYGRPFSAEQLSVFRQDQRSHVAVRDELVNDVDPIYADDPYNYLHVGGAHLFVEGYEHYLVFNNYTTSGSLIYDPFLGLQTKKFGVDYFEKQDYTLRPTLGGHYLVDGQFRRNIEGSIEDVRNMYDASELTEGTEFAKRARALLGYAGREQFLDYLNTNSKSQFLFYRGMIQTKGSMNSIDAYINSRRFIDARIDEYWAWKLAEFGDARVRTYPQVKLLSEDGMVDDLKFMFLAGSETPADQDVQDAVNKGFEVIEFKNEDRWNISPEQKADVKTPLFLDTTVSEQYKVLAGNIPPHGDGEFDFWFHTPTQRLYAFDAETQDWTNQVTDRVFVDEVNVVGSTPVKVVYFKPVASCDDVRIITKTVAKKSSPIVSVNPQPADATSIVTVQGNISGTALSGRKFAITGQTPNVGLYKAVSAVYDEPLNVTYVTVSGLLQPNSSGYVETHDLSNYTITAPDSTEVRVNSQLLRMPLDQFVDIIQITFLTPAYGQISPARLIDTKSHTTAATLPAWDPARGVHSPVARGCVTIASSSDPAKYSEADDVRNLSGSAWNSEEVGATWLDESSMWYVPYYDDKVFPDDNVRLAKWGNMLQAGTVRVFEWTQSPVAPDQWEAHVLSQANDPAVSQAVKASGTARAVPVIRKRTSMALEVVDGATGTFACVSGDVAEHDQVVFSATNVLEGLEPAVKYIATNVTGGTFKLTDPSAETIVTTTANVGTQTLVMPVFKASDWREQQPLMERVTAPEVVKITRQLFGTPYAVLWPYSVTMGIGRVTLAWNSSNASSWNVNEDRVDVYVNGVVIDSGVVVRKQGDSFYVDLNLTALTLAEVDIIDIVRPVVAPTVELRLDEADDGTAEVETKLSYQYSVVNGQYFFWVENANTKSAGRALSMRDVAAQLISNPNPYMIVQHPKDDPYLFDTYGYGMTKYGSVYSAGVLLESEYDIPVLYRKAIFRKITGIIKDSNRYVIQFTRDWTLRDRSGATAMDLKNKHEEWMLFRRNQPTTIPRELWTRLTEALVGYSVTPARSVTCTDYPLVFSAASHVIPSGYVNLSNVRIKTAAGVWMVEGVDYAVDAPRGTIELLSTAVFDGGSPYVAKAGFTHVIPEGAKRRVPDLERELYDTKNGTDTRFGMGDGQAFVDRRLGMSTLYAYLTNPANDFSPISIDRFFESHNLDTAEGVAAAMETIYTTFSAEHVNAIWFEALHDALTTRAKYRELFKTSWVALHGIRVLEVNGMFDD